MRVLPGAILALAILSPGLAGAAIMVQDSETDSAVAAPPAAVIAAPIVMLPAPVITQPVWERQPSPQDLHRFFPGQAARHMRSGKAVLRCRVSGDGTLEGCIVASETPTGLKFGEQALKLAPLFKMPPQTNGEPVAGKVVVVPIQFKLS